ncbi:MAG TPA: helix-turn-helix transcriptional regulator [Pseudonocardiaceae bacterium]
MAEAVIDPAGPAVGRRRLARELRRLRTRTGRSVHDVAVRLSCSPARISRLETGVVAANPRDVRELLDLYAVPGDERERLLCLARQARQRAWWQDFADVVPPESVRLYQLEAGATRIDGYHGCTLLPGLLQSVGYARALMGVAPVDRTTVDRRLELRVRRKELLTRTEEPPPRIRFVVTEAALLARVGGPDAHADQLRHLVEVAGLPNVSIRVLPLGAGPHRAMGLMFTLYAFADEADQRIVYLEQLTANSYVERLDQVAEYASAFDEAHELALDPYDSRMLIAEHATNVR